MMKINFKKALAAVVGMSLAACTSAMTASASSAGATVEIEQKSLTVSEASALNYRVPIFVKLTENAGLTAMEFGVEISDDLSYTVYRNNRSARPVLRAAAEAVPDKFEVADIDLNMTTADSSTENMTWAAWADSTTFSYSDINVLMIAVDIPSTVAGGEHYDITYREYGVGTNPSHHLYKNGSANYVTAGTVDYSDGWIEITS